MARHQSGRLIETVPAVAGLIFTLAAAVQFLDTELYIGVLELEILTSHAFVVSLAALVVVFASSRTKNWEYYETWEQVFVGTTLLIMTAHQFLPTVESVVSNQNPLAGGTIFLMGLITWGVLAR